MPRSGGDPLDARQSGAGGGGGPPSGSSSLHRPSSAPVEVGGAVSAPTDRSIALAAAPGAPAAVPEHPATIGRPTFRDCAINAVAVVPLLGGSTSSIGGGGGGGGDSHSLESFASLLDSLRHFAKSSASGDEPEMSQGMRMRAEAGGSGRLCVMCCVPAMRVRGFKHCSAMHLCMYTQMDADGTMFVLHLVATC